MGEAEYSVLADSLKPSSRRYTDSEVPEESIKYSYRLRIVPKEGDPFVTKEKSFLYQAMDRIAAPTNVTARLIKKEEEFFVHLSWDAVKDAKRFLVYADLFEIGEMRRDGTIGRITESHCDLRFPHEGGRNYTFEVHPFDKEGYSGKIARLTTYLPYTSLPKVNDLKVQWHFTGDVKFSWEFPMIRDLKGFRIVLPPKKDEEGKVIVKEKVLVDEKTLGPRARSYVLDSAVFPEKDEHQSYYPTLVVLGELGVTQDTRRVLEVPAKRQRIDKSLRGPRSINFWVEENEEGKYVAKCFWDWVDLDAYGLEGYLIDLRFPYQHQHKVLADRKNPAKKNKHYHYVLPDSCNINDRIKVRVQSVGKNGRLGPFIEAEAWVF
jgi:hypothetical protein